MLRAEARALRQPGRAAADRLHARLPGRPAGQKRRDAHRGDADGDGPVPGGGQQPLPWRVRGLVAARERRGWLHAGRRVRRRLPGPERLRRPARGAALAVPGLGAGGDADLLLRGAAGGHARLRQGAPAPLLCLSGGGRARGRPRGEVRRPLHRHGPLRAGAPRRGGPAGRPRGHPADGARRLPLRPLGLKSRTIHIYIYIYICV
mmetsp:Transcript_49223/g.145315  ORF Transcript_49223/g.145315 Transcript_49223/m.145315 type:complete len:205 (-) Transcript_49223:1424-2038(-)